MYLLLYLSQDPACAPTPCVPEFGIVKGDVLRFECGCACHCAYCKVSEGKFPSVSLSRVYTRHIFCHQAEHSREIPVVIIFDQDPFFFCVGDSTCVRADLLRTACQRQRPVRRPD